jgi:hypothetical protein
MKQTEMQFWIESYQFWLNARQMTGFNGMVLYHINNSRKNLAKEIRKAEKKLNRQPRRLPHCGCVQYIQKVIV